MTQVITRKTTYTRRLLCLLLCALLCTMCLAPLEKASAAGIATGIGLAEHGIKAHAEGWKYMYGGKGQVVGGTRVSDCAGLIYAYFTDMGMTDPAGNCSGHVHMSPFHGTISEGLPNIHGLLLTMPEYYAPETGLYSHIGIYIGAGMATDNSDSITNMRRLPVNTPGRDWNAWHLLDNGLLYPSNGWYVMDKKLTHYTNYEYDTDTVIDGLQINSEGYAVDGDGNYLSTDAAVLSEEFVSANTVAAYLATRYSGHDNTADLIYGTQPDPDDPTYNGTITGSGVNLRAAATTQSTVVAVLHRGDRLKITGEVQGQSITNTSNGKTSTLWYAVTDTRGRSGFVSSLFVEKKNNVGLVAAPTITCDGYFITIESPLEGAAIYYTTDGTEPTEDSTPYVGPIYETGCTVKAFAKGETAVSEVATATITSNGSLFTDFTFADWFAPNVDQAVTYGLFSGVGDNMFAPKKQMQRGQFVLMLANIAGVGLSGYSGETDYTDVKADAYYAKAVQWASDRGLISGSGGKFRPTDPITRQEMCVLLAKFTGVGRLGDGSPFADDGKIADWAKNAVYACRDAGLVGGVGNDRFDPTGTATRAQACVVAVKCYRLSY